MELHKKTFSGFFPKAVPDPLKFAGLITLSIIYIWINS